MVQYVGLGLRKLSTDKHNNGEMESSVGTNSETAGKQMKLHTYLTCNYMKGRSKVRGERRFIPPQGLEITTSWLDKDFKYEKGERNQSGQPPEVSRKANAGVLGISAIRKVA